MLKISITISIFLYTQCYHQTTSFISILKLFNQSLILPVQPPSQKNYFLIRQHPISKFQNNNLSMLWISFNHSKTIQMKSYALEKMVYLKVHFYLINYIRSHNVIEMNIQKSRRSKQNQIATEMKIQHQQLDSLKLSQVFEEAKYLINGISGENILVEKTQYTKNRLKLISEFAVRKLKSKDNIETKRFIGLFSIFCFVTTASENPQTSLNFSTIFYRNLSKYISAVVNTFCAENKQNKIEGDPKNFLITFLYSLVSLYENKNKLGQLDLKKIFSLGTVKNLLRLKINDDQRSMRLYRILVLYLYENKHKNLSDTHFIESLTYHMVNCHSNKNTEAAIIFLLNRILKNKNFFISDDFSELSGKLAKIVISKSSSIQVSRLGFSLLSKLIDRDNRVSINLLAVDDLIFLIHRFYSQSPDNYKLNSSIALILANLSNQNSFKVYKQLVFNQKLTNISLEILECLTRKANENLIFDIVTQGFGEKLLEWQEGEASQYHKQLVNRIMKNVVQSNMSNNSLMAQALKRVLSWRQYSFLARSSSILHYPDLY